MMISESTYRLIQICMDGNDTASISKVIPGTTITMKYDATDPRSGVVIRYKSKVVTQADMIVKKDIADLYEHAKEKIAPAQTHSFFYYITKSSIDGKIYGRKSDMIGYFGVDGVPTQIAIDKTLSAQEFVERIVSICEDKGINSDSVFMKIGKNIFIVPITKKKIEKIDDSYFFVYKRVLDLAYTELSFIPENDGSVANIEKMLYRLGFLHYNICHRYDLSPTFPVDCEILWNYFESTINNNMLPPWCDTPNKSHLYCMMVNMFIRNKKISTSNYITDKDKQKYNAIRRYIAE